MKQKHKQQTVLCDGIVTEIIDSDHKIRCRIPDQNLVTKPLPFLVPYAKDRKAYALPAIGTHVKVLLDQAGEEGVILGCFYDAKVSPPVGDRAIVRHEFPPHLFEFNEDTGVLRINCTKIEINVEQGMHLTNQKETTINSKAVAVIGAMDNDSESNGPDALVSSNQL